MFAVSFCFCHMDLVIYHVIKFELTFKGKYVGGFVSNLREKDC